jgi:hypothetical protein
MKLSGLPCKTQLRGRAIQGMKLCIALLQPGIFCKSTHVAAPETQLEQWLISNGGSVNGVQLQVTESIEKQRDVVAVEVMTQYNHCHEKGS